MCVHLVFSSVRVLQQNPYSHNVAQSKRCGQFSLTNKTLRYRQILWYLRHLQGFFKSVDFFYKNSAVFAITSLLV